MRSNFRLYWCLLSLSMLALFLYMGTKQLIVYLRHPSGTKITIRSEKPLEFPAVTICNQNNYRKSVIGNDSVTQQIIRNLYPIDVTDTSEAVTSQALQTDTSTGQAVYDWSLAAAHRIEDMVWQAWWKGRRIEVNDYFKRVFTDQGICYTFHSAEYVKANGSMFVNRTGSDYGLWLRMSVEHDEYFFGYTSSAGFKVSKLTYCFHCVHG